MNKNYVIPRFNEKAFNCPNCQAYAHQVWIDVYMKTYGQRNEKFKNLVLSRCYHCEKLSLWFKESLLYPKQISIPLPHEDMSESIKEDYLEAREIVTSSPKAACALLRLAIQKLMKELGEKEKRLVDNIVSLASKGLPVKIQKALDIVRVIGNESVHPGQINLNDNKEIAYSLFELINLIIEDRISAPKRVNELYEKLPERKKIGLQNRDKKE